MNERLVRQLDAVDWDFLSREPGTSHAIHWYPGTFPAQLPAAIIEALSRPDDLVFDPYGGIGTTAAEALRLGRRAWTVDSNPIAFLSAYTMGCLTMLQGHSPGSSSVLIRDMLGFALGPSRTGASLFPPGNGEPYRATRALDQLVRPIPDHALATLLAKLPPQWSLLDPWYEPSTLRDIKALFHRLLEARIPSFSKMVWLTMLSAVLRPASSQTRSYGHLADNVLPAARIRKDVHSLCDRWAARTSATVAALQTRPGRVAYGRRVRLWATQDDWTADSIVIHPRPREQCSLLVTSPPYANAIDYVRGQRLSLYLLGYSDSDVTTLGQHEIGARRNRFKADSATTWGTAIAAALSVQASFVKCNGFAALVLPHKDHGREIGSTMIRDFFADPPWHPVFSTERSIQQFRTRHSWTSIKKETLDVYQQRPARG